MRGSPPAPPLAPPAKRRAPYTPIVAPAGACSTPYAIISGNPQLTRFNDYILVRSFLMNVNFAAAGQWDSPMPRHWPLAECNALSWVHQNYSVHLLYLLLGVKSSTSPYECCSTNVCKAVGRWAMCNTVMHRCVMFLQANALQGALSPNNQSLTVFAPVNDAFNVQAFEVSFSGTHIGWAR
jgi:hypothetical protein